MYIIYIKIRGLLKFRFSFTKTLIMRKKVTENHHVKKETGK